MQTDDRPRLRSSSAGRPPTAPHPRRPPAGAVDRSRVLVGASILVRAFAAIALPGYATASACRRRTPAKQRRTAARDPRRMAHSHARDLADLAHRPRPVDDTSRRRDPTGADLYVSAFAHLRRRPDRLLIDPRERGTGAPDDDHAAPCRSRPDARCSEGRPYLDAHGSPLAGSGSPRDSPRISSSSHRSKEQHMTSIAPQGLRAPNSPGRGSDTNLPEETS